METEKEKQLTLIRRRLAWLTFLNTDDEDKRLLVKASNCLLSAIKIDDTGNFFLETISSMVDPLDKPWCLVDDDTMTTLLRAMAFDAHGINTRLFCNWRMGFYARTYRSAVKKIMTAMFGDRLNVGRVFDVKCRTVESASQFIHHFRALIETGHPLTVDHGPIQKLMRRIRIEERKQKESVTIVFPYSQMKISREGSDWTAEYKITF